MGTLGIIISAIKPTKLVLGFGWDETTQPLPQQEWLLITLYLADSS